MGKWFIRQSTCCASRSARVLDPWHAYENLGVVAHTYNPSARKQILNGRRNSTGFPVYAFGKLQCPCYWGSPQKDCYARGLRKGAGMNHWTFSRKSVCFLACTLLLIEWKPIQCDYLACYLRMGSSVWKKHIKEVVESADSSAGQLLAIHSTSEFSVLISESTQEHGVPCFLFRSEGCQIGWPQDTPAFSPPSKFSLSIQTCGHLL